MEPSDMNHVVTLRILFGEGDEEEMVVEAQLHTPSELDSTLIVQSLLNYLARNAQEVIATNPEGQVLYRDARDVPLSLTIRAPQEKN